MSAFVVFTRTKTIDQKELEKYWTGIQATIKGHPIEVLVAYGKHEVLEGWRKRMGKKSPDTITATGVERCDG